MRLPKVGTSPFLSITLKELFLLQRDAQDFLQKPGETKVILETVI